MCDLITNSIKQYAEQNPLVNDFFGMMDSTNMKKIDHIEKINSMKRMHELEYHQYNLHRKQCAMLGEVIVVIGVLNCYMK